MQRVVQKLSESGRQFQEIFEEFHDPAKRVDRRIKFNREEREKLNREDKGL